MDFHFDQIEKLLLRERVILLDGGLATQLEENGVVLDTALWSSYCLVSHPSLIQQIHKQYLQSGSRIITTCTYQANFAAFDSVGIGKNEALRLINEGVDLAFNARFDFMQTLNISPMALIAASMGPFGATIPGGEYSGAYGETVTYEEIESFHEERFVNFFLNTRVDLILFETIPCASEAKMIAQMCLKMIQTNEDRGESLEAILKYLNEDQFWFVAGIGINCTDPNYILSLIREIKKYSTKKFIVVYPNSGEIYDPSTKKWLNPKDEVCIEDLTPLWVTEGANIIGGCCRTSPKTIERIKSSLFKHNS